MNDDEDFQTFVLVTCLTPSAGDGPTFNALLPSVLVPDLPGSRECVEMTSEPWKPSQQPIAVGNRVQISRTLFSAIYQLLEKNRRRKSACLPGLQNRRAETQKFRSGKRLSATHAFSGMGPSQ